jgi:hypothetical protein
MLWILGENRRPEGDSRRNQRRELTLFQGEANSIISSYNRNFSARNDANPATHAFLASPELVMAMSFAGSLSFNPVTDTINGPDGEPFKFSAPVGDELPSRGYVAGRNLYQGPPADDIRRSLSVSVNPSSARLQLLSPFAPWDGQDYEACPILIKVSTLHCLTLTASGQGQMHDRPYHPSWALAQIPRSFGEHLEQHSDWRDERRHGGNQRGHQLHNW